MSDDRTARFALPLLAAGQAQKEITHNEALETLDLALQATVLAADVDVPPGTPNLGDCWIVGDDPEGVWADRSRKVAGWTAGGWRFLDPHEGMTVWVRDRGVAARYSGDGWVYGEVAASRIIINGAQVVGARLPDIAYPVAGTSVDAEARTALAAILAALRHHGLIGDRP